MVTSLSINCTLRHGVASLKLEPVAQLRVIRHIAQPAACLDFLMVSGAGIRIYSEIASLGDESEVGRISMRDLNSNELDVAAGAFGEYWNSRSISAPAWLFRPRKLSILSFQIESLNVDTGLTFSDSRNELRVLSSSFPGCVEILCIADGVEKCCFDLPKVRPEYRIDQLTSRII